VRAKWEIFLVPHHLWSVTAETHCNWKSFSLIIKKYAPVHQLITRTSQNMRINITKSWEIRVPTHKFMKWVFRFKRKWSNDPKKDIKLCSVSVAHFKKECSSTSLNFSDVLSSWQTGISLKYTLISKLAWLSLRNLNTHLSSSIVIIECAVRVSPWEKE